ncbi:hypothetical protein ON010_g3084 [Phytophthora cinnamomi]|nr:hypothetical protein ON010_g3084 [Phytophthora cinnamomi]
MTQLVESELARQQPPVLRAGEHGVPVQRQQVAAVQQQTGGAGGAHGEREGRARASQAPLGDTRHDNRPPPNRFETTARARDARATKGGTYLIIRPRTTRPTSIAEEGAATGDEDEPAGLSRPAGWLDRSLEQLCAPKRHHLH